MTIERGRDWGSVEPFPEGGLIVDSDLALSALLMVLRAADEPIPAIALTAGDLHRTLGGPDTATRVREGEATVAAIDVAEVRFEGQTRLMVAHARLGRLFGGDGVVVMNAQWIDELDLGPRSHPGDGMLDLTSGSLGLRQRLQARTRARTGTHLPHPGLTTSRADRVEWTARRPLSLHIDGAAVGRTRTLGIDLLPTQVRVWV